MIKFIKQSKLLVLCLPVFTTYGWSQAPVNENQISASEYQEGFRLLFDGTREGFQNNFVNYVQNNSTHNNLHGAWVLNKTEQAIHCEDGHCSDIRSTENYADFDLRFSFRNSGESGLYYRFTFAEATPWLTGLQFVLQDLSQPHEKMTLGSVLDLYAPSQKPKYHNFDSKKWNELRLVCIGDSIQHWINGDLILAYRLHSADFWNRVEMSKWITYQKTFTLAVKGDKSKGPILRGYIGFQGNNGGALLLRKIRIKTENVSFNPQSATEVLRLSKKRNSKSLNLLGSTITPDSFTKPGYHGILRGRNKNELSNPQKTPPAIKFH